MQKVQVTDILRNLHLHLIVVCNLQRNCRWNIKKNLLSLVQKTHSLQLNFVMSHFGRFMCDPVLAFVCEMGSLRHPYAMWSLRSVSQCQW